MTDIKTKTPPAFSLVAFAPGWGATVMGTGVVSVIFSALVRHEFLPGVMRAASLIMLVVTILLGAVVLTLTTLRWVRHFDVVRGELRHPIMGAMHVTYGGALLVPAVALGRAGELVLPQSVLTPLILLLTALGSVITLGIGWVFLTGIFRRGDVQAGLITGAWFIPPVLAIVIPLALAPTIQAGSAVSRELLWLSWGALGIGTFLYLALTAVLFYRHATLPLPPAHVAPTIIIGMGPAGLIGLDVLTLSEVGARAGMTPEVLTAFMQPVAVAAWGFGLWWGIAAVIVIRRGYQSRPFGLPGWAYTFPYGAWVVGGIMIGYAVSSYVIITISIAAAALMLGVWAWAATGTLRGIRTGDIWEA